MPGSSPRVRGKQTRHSRGRLQVGLIPACAGKTSDPPISPLSHRAHPRVCGENAIARAAGPGFEGSSPRVRGKHRFGVGIRTERGLIPACAGKTSRRISIYANTSGSSPRVRGKRYVRPFALQNIGLIPACAGKTAGASGSREAGPAHPRVCGENLLARRTAAQSSGSSPRVRGKPTVLDRPLEEIGLIPACAGKTSRRCRKDL